MTDSVLNWGSGLLDPRLRDYIRDNFSSVRVQVHTTEPRPDSKAELYTAPNSGATVWDLLEAARALGLKVHLCLDFHHGNGRQEAGGSPTLAGRYHTNSEGRYWIAEGGMRDALDRLFEWMPDHVESLQIANEPKEDAAWLADWMGRNAWPYAAQLRDRKRRSLKLIGHWGDSGWAEVSAKWCDGLDVHAIRSRAGRAAEKVRDARSSGLPVYLFELTAERPEDTASEIEAAIRAGAVAVGGFLGDLENFPDAGRVRWNFRDHPTFNCFSNHGPTPVGRAWDEIFGNEGPRPDPVPVPPPDPDPSPEPPPAPSPPATCNCERARIQNAKALGALRAGRIKVAQAILERQAATLSS